MRRTLIGLALLQDPTNAFLSPYASKENFLGFCLHAHDQVPAFSVIDDDDDDIDSTSKQPYRPPDFTIEDDDDDNESASKQPYIPPDFTIEDDGDEDPYAESISSRVGKRPPRPKRQPRPTPKMQGTSWMQKNAKFSGDKDGMADNESLPDTRDSRRQTSRSNVDSKTFRQDFRATRVFVEGIPMGTSWQDLKDHFRVAGNVVFASVSVDPQTGQARGHGIVQFETTSMAENAIRIMRDYPLHGANLFVREDVQESKKPNTPKGPTPPTKWKCANEDNASYMSEEELTAIRGLIKARDDARRRRKYDVSDLLRDELKNVHGVFMDDRLKMWWTSMDGSKVPQSIEEIKGQGRWGKQQPWRQIPTTPENDICVNPDLVEGLLKQRDIARREKDFSTADALLEEARTSPDGDLTLRIHDESRTWRVWTDAPPPRPVEHHRFDDPRERAAQECVEIVEEFAPHKVDEIRMVLRKFEGREFQVLKRLKNQYLR